MIRSPDHPISSGAIMVHTALLVGEWLSLVEHLVRDQGVGGSNPLSPTNLFQNQLFTGITTCSMNPLVLDQVIRFWYVAALNRKELASCRTCIRAILPWGLTKRTYIPVESRREAVSKF